jgi:hypothetical protein
MREMREMRKIREMRKYFLPHLPSSYELHFLHLPHLPHLPYLHKQKDQLLMTTPLQIRDYGGGFPAELLVLSSRRRLRKPISLSPS